MSDRADLDSPDTAAAFDPMPQIHRDLALHMDRSYLQNRGHLLRQTRLFRVVSILLVVEVVAWVVDLLVQS